MYLCIFDNIAPQGQVRVNLSYHCEGNFTNPCCKISNLFTDNVVHQNFERFIQILKFSILSFAKQKEDPTFLEFANRLSFLVWMTVHKIINTI